MLTVFEKDSSLFGVEVAVVTPPNPCSDEELYDGVLYKLLELISEGHRALALVTTSKQLIKLTIQDRKDKREPQVGAIEVPGGMAGVLGVYGGTVPVHVREIENDSIIFIANAFENKGGTTNGGMPR